MVRAHIGVVILAVGFLGGCPADDQPEVDASPDGDASADVDADVTAPSLHFTFVSEPEIPGDITEEDYDGTIEEAVIALENVSAVSDSVGPGDERTTLAEFVLHFGVDRRLNQISFPEAPPGIYSHLRAQIDAYSIVGTVTLDTDPIPFEIEDTPPTPLSLSIELEGVIVEDQRTDVVIEVDLEGLFKEIDWSAAEVDDGAIEIDDESSLIEGVRAQLLESFDHED